MARHIPQYMNTEEHFLLSSVNEFVKFWASGNQGFLNVNCENGRATLSLGFQLSSPQAPHFFPFHQNISPNHHNAQKKGPSRLARDCKRAAKHQANKNTADPVVENIPTQACNSAVSAKNNTFSNSVSPSPPLQPKFILPFRSSFSFHIPPVCCFS